MQPYINDVCVSLLGEEAAKKVEFVPLSNNSVSKRIVEMATNIQSSVREQISQHKKSALQVDEPVDIVEIPQLVVYVRYINGNDMKEEFMFCEQLQTASEGEDIFRVVDTN